MFVKCSEHKKSTQLSRDFKIISSLLSKARHDLPSTELLAHYSIQFIFNSRRNFRNHKFTSLCRPSRNHENVKKVIASFILVSCVAFFFSHKPICLRIKTCRNIHRSQRKPFSRGGILKCLGQWDSTQRWGQDTDLAMATLQTNMKAFLTSICQLNINLGSLPFF